MTLRRGSPIRFHRITDAEAVFVADICAARTIVVADLDCSSGQAVFGSLTPGTGNRLESPHFTRSTVPVCRLRTAVAMALHHSSGSVSAHPECSDGIEERSRSEEAVPLRGD
jgi:hypothetical protein